MAALQKYVTENISGEQQNMQHDSRILDPTVAALLQIDFAIWGKRDQLKKKCWSTTWYNNPRTGKKIYMWEALGAG